MSLLQSDIPLYSDLGRDSIELMHLDYASFFFYFEDAHHEAVYERFLEKLFPQLRGVVVLCLGGKTKVLSKAKQSRFPKITSVFIVDRDFDEFIEKLEDISDVFYLEKFSFENYLADRDALINLCIDENSRSLTKMRAGTSYSDYSEFRHQLVEKLLRLTKIYLVARRYSISVETTKVSFEDLLEDLDALPIPSDQKIEAYLDRVLGACAVSKDKEWLTDRRTLIEEGERIFLAASISQDVDYADFCCGKHLLGCTVQYFDQRIANKIRELDPVNMYVRLLSYVDVSTFAKFRKSLSDFYQWA